MHIFCAVVGLSFKVLPAGYAATLWAGGLFVYYMLTSFGEPEHTGALQGVPGRAGLAAQGGLLGTGVRAAGAAMPAGRGRAG